MGESELTNEAYERAKAGLDEPGAAEPLTEGIKTMGEGLATFPRAYDGSRDALTEYFEAHAIQPLFGYWIRETCEGLKEFVINKERLVRSNARRGSELRRLGQLANDMRLLLGDMPDGTERFHLGLALGRVGMLPADVQEGDAAHERVEAVVFMLEGLVRGVESALNDVPIGKKGGRPEITEPYAKFVYRIARDCEMLGIEPARNKEFTALCWAVFSAAGIHTDKEKGPEAAIRYYVTHYKPKGKAMGNPGPESPA